jgi:ribosomal-protein-alanine acetyltransferase
MLKDINRMPHRELKILYQNCFPEKDAETEIKALGDKFEFLIRESSFIIYSIVSPDEAEIIDVGTAPECRNKGMAKNLLEKIIDKLRQQGIKTVFLEVGENNKPALRLYEKSGFQKYNVRKDYYKTATGRTNAVLMKKSI